MSTGIIFDVKRFSIHDGPGIRTTVFLKGCPLRCWWCHNPEGQVTDPELMLRPDRCIGCDACVEVCSTGAIHKSGVTILTFRDRCRSCGACGEVCYAEARELVGRSVTVADVMAEVLQDIPFYDESGGGVTFSGGEPLSQPEFLGDVLSACRARGLHTAVDTCGFASDDVLDRIRTDVDLFLYDLKLMDEMRHQEATGVSNEPILRNLRRLSREGHRIILRVPVIPEVNDDEDNLRRIGALAASLPGLERVDLLPYHHMGRDKYRQLGKVGPMPDSGVSSGAPMAEISRTLREFGLRVSIG